jgi:N-acetylglucosamine repressor
MQIEPAPMHMSDRRTRIAAVLTELWSNGSASRSRMVEITGMALPSVSRLVQELKNTGMLIEVEKGQSTGGRQPLLVQINPQAGLALGLDLSGIELQGALLDAANQPRVILRQPYRGMEQEILQEQVIQLCQTLLEHPLAQASPVMGIGVSVPGSIDAKKGVIEDSTNMRLHHYPIGDILRDKFHLPVFLEHDTAAAALAEQVYGAGRGKKDLIYIMVSTGVGAGIVTNGQIYRGSSGLAGELGHVIFERNGPVCACGKRGCLEVFAAVPAILSNVQNVLSRANRAHWGPVGRAVTEPLTLADLKYALDECDPLVEAIIRRAADSLALAVSIMVTIIDIKLVILGGEINQIGDYYIRALQTLLENYLDGGAPEIEVVPAALGESASLMGVGMMVLSHTLVERFA